MFPDWKVSRGICRYCFILKRGRNRSRQMDSAFPFQLALSLGTPGHAVTVTDAKSWVLDRAVVGEREGVDMVLEQLGVWPVATAIVPEPVWFRRSRHAAHENRAERLKTDLPHPLSFPCRSAGAAELPGQPLSSSRSSLPSHIGDIPPAADLCAVERIREGHCCLSLKAARRHFTAAGCGQVPTAIRAPHSPACLCSQCL